MIYQIDKPYLKHKPTNPFGQDVQQEYKSDGIPPIELSYSAKNLKTPKYMQNEDDDEDRMSIMSDFFDSKDKRKFIKVYNT
jgi:hypothetical protein